MDLGSANNPGILPGYNFEHFEDDVSKEETELTVDAGFPTTDAPPFRTSQSDVPMSNPEMITDISQVQLLQEGVQPADEGHDGKKKGGCPKGRKRKKMRRDVNAPRQPLTGYIRYLNDRRDKFRAENPMMSFSEVTKIMGREWSQLPQQDKQQYLDEAERDKERYMRELEAYYKTEAYKIFIQRKNERKRKEAMGEEDSGQSAVNGTTIEPAPVDVSMKEEESGTFDVPIFTEEFLDHNKVREAELRQLRKQNTELEEQNAILSKHIENMKMAIEKLEVEAVQQRGNNMALQQHLDGLRTTLTTNFSTVPLPGSNETPRLETIDAYMAKLHSVILDAPQENANLISTVRDIVGRLNFDT